MSENPVLSLVRGRAGGEARGIYSACTASPLVIEAVCRRAAINDTYALIEATANQVNQFGGYSGLRPDDYAALVHGISERCGLRADLLILGGDHLGPLVWKSEPEGEAMGKAGTLIEAFIRAGFTKIHVDTSMRLSGDSMDEPLTDAVIAARAADLISRAAGGNEDVAYVIGSEVPVPGGAQETEGVAVTTPEAYETTVNAFRDAFLMGKIGHLWQSVAAVVVQPGVEFSDDSVHEYDGEKAAGLFGAARRNPDMTLEAHSTDYQTRKCLRAMVDDGAGILKVGPALTFALREGLFALEHIERALASRLPGALSGFSGALERAMAANPGNWSKYYHGDDESLAFKRFYSYSDRCRYYLSDASVGESLDRLLRNLSAVNLPLSLVSQYLPAQYAAVREGRLDAAPKDLLLDKVGGVIDDYLYATRAGPSDNQIIGPRHTGATNG